jgi:molecular chaperone Hsp33
MAELMVHSEQETGFDRTLSFTIPERDARGRVVRLGPVLDRILSAHAYPPAVTHLLAEALVLTVLLGSLLKEPGGQLTLQVQGEGGAADLLVCDYREGELRGYVRHDPEKIAGLGANPPLGKLLGAGHAAVTFDLPGAGGRYQGVVPLEGESLAQVCEHYFSQSEQLPTLIRVAIRSGPGGCVGAGLLMQHLPGGEEGRERLHVRLDHPEWDHVAVMAGSIRHDELADPALPLEALVWRLFHEEAEVRVERGGTIARGCRCSADHYRRVLGGFPEEERREMRNDKGEIVIDCVFCSRVIPVNI